MKSDNDIDREYTSAVLAVMKGRLGRVRELHAKASASEVEVEEAELSYLAAKRDYDKAHRLSVNDVVNQPGYYQPFSPVGEKATASLETERDHG